MRESEVESYFNRRVKLLGGITFKFTSVNCRGVPDRIAIIPGVGTFFVELKAPDKKLRPLQEYRQSQIINSGGLSFWCSSIQQVDDLLDSLINH